MIAIHGIRKEFLNMLADVGIESVRLPPKSPNWNAHAERLVRTIKEECVEQMIFFGEDSLRSGVRNFVEYDHHERNHQGLDNRLVIPMKRTVNTGGRIQQPATPGRAAELLLQGGVDILPR